MVSLNFVKPLMRILFKADGLQGKGFDFLLWFAGEIYSKVENVRSNLNELGGELERIESMKVRIEALLKDADERRKIEDETVMLWLRDLYNLSLDAEDLLHLVRTRTHDPSRQQQAAPTAAPNRYKRKRFWPASAYPCSSSVPRILFNNLVAEEAAAIKSGLNEITDRKKKLRLQRGDGDRHSPAATDATTSAGQAVFVGMARDTQTIITFLLQPSAAMVVAIKGIGGSGKTATAKSAYNDETLTTFFGAKIWIDVKRSHGAERIASEMLESLGERRSFCNFDTSLGRIKELVSGKKVLVVLDNTEEGFLPSWATVRATLRAAASGSRVLVTTTSSEVARYMGATTYQLRGLYEDEWLQLFTSRMGDLSADPQLLEIARKIGRRCQLSPFAAKSLGGLMSGSGDVREWEAVLGDETRQGTPDEGGKAIQQMLRKSYEFLPLHLKRCFAFCAIFPDDHDLDMEELAKMWVALGFIQGGNHSTEAVGRRWFRQLEAKSFFEVSAQQKVETSTEHKGCYYKIPRLMHDLARSMSADESLTIGNGGRHENHDAISKDARHMLLNCNRLGTEPEVLDSFLQQADHRRTFIMLQCLSTLPTDLFLKMPCLRVLDLSCTAIYNLPESVGELKLLRYLNLFNTNIAKLPDSVTSLHNLQTLNLGDCYFLHEIPQKTSNLTDLRHLDLRLSHPRRSRLASTPPNIGKLTRLQTLSRFIVGEKSEGCGIDQLQCLEDIYGDLWLSKLENVEDADDAREARLVGKEKISTLTLEWTTTYEVSPQPSDSGSNPITPQPDSRPHRKEHSDPEKSSSSTSTSSSSMIVSHPPSSVQSPRNNIVANSVIEQLHPPPYLKTLRIDGFYGDTLPGWVRQMKHLVSVRISHCQFPEPLTMLEMLPKLTHVHLEQLGRVTALKPSDSTHPKFVSLETVILRNMTNLVEWSINHAQMPKLKVLHFFNCSKVTDPSRLFPPCVVEIYPEVNRLST